MSKWCGRKEFVEGIVGKMVLRNRERRKGREVMCEGWCGVNEGQVMRDDVEGRRRVGIGRAARASA